MNALETPKLVCISQYSLMLSCAESFYETGPKHLKMFCFCIKNMLTLLVK